MPFQQLTRGYISSTCGSEATHSVSGIFCDVMKSDKERLQNLGMIWQPIPLDSLDDALAPAIPALRTCEPKKFLLGSHPRDPFLTKAAFYGTNTSHVQKLRRRCVGILAEMQDGCRMISANETPAQGKRVNYLRKAERSAGCNYFSLFGWR